MDVLPPGGLSDHSMIIGSAYLLKDGCDDTVTRCARSWRSFDLDAFLHDLCQSVLVLSPPSDPDELFTEYHRTLTSLLDQHAPVRRRRTPSRRSAPWYDNECHECKQTTRRLERTHHRYSAEYSVTARHAWRRQFQSQRLLFRRKAAGPTTGRPQSVSVATTLDCCGRRSVSCWILVRRANYTILPTIWQIISR